MVLRGLPIDADLTLVQGLIHGGAIDTFALGVNSTAAVTFTSADACDTYFAKYPNGVAFKYKGKSYVAFVEKGSEVNVISGMLQGHLECGASRCVRAVGVDHDWGMGALMKLAAGKNRKVEHIGDGLRGQVSPYLVPNTFINAYLYLRSVPWCSASHPSMMLLPLKEC